MGTSDVQAMREVLRAVLQAGGIVLAETDLDRLALELRDFAADGRYMIAAVPPSAEPQPVVSVED